MTMNAQHKRVNKNRVSITYDVEVNGESENRELPFVVGVVGDFSGHKPADKKCAPEDREFTGIDNDNFNDVMAQINPELTFNVTNTLSDDGSEFPVELSFTSMADFHPENLVNQIAPLKPLVETRNQLKTLLSKADRSRDLEQLLKEILQNTEALSSLNAELAVPEAG